MFNTLPENEIRAWLRLALENGVGPAKARTLLAAVGPPQDVFAASARVLSGLVGADLGRQLRQRPQPAMTAAIDAALRWLAEPGHHVLTLADPRYPSVLLDTHDPPILLYVQGDPAMLSRPGIAVVGARNASPGGMEHAAAFSCFLARRGWCVVSGLASGIDAGAHEGALSAGPRAAGTVAVLGTGIDVVYPPRNRDLARRIAREGALVSEFPLGAKALTHHFPRRNRIVAGMTHGVLVVEAAKQSGSLITARLALDAGREVFAIPGSIQSPLARGCHALIRQGAKLVESGRDILDELGAGMTMQDAQDGHAMRGDTHPRSRPHPRRQACVIDDRNAQPLAVAPHPDLQTVLDAMGHDPIHVDLILRRTALAVPVLNSRLAQLELDDHIVRLADGRLQRRMRSAACLSR
ncbi:MAG: DNA-processing protein DprA [Candidimonas sp.]|jgi:DNA processing protein